MVRRSHRLAVVAGLLASWALATPAWAQRSGEPTPPPAPEAAPPPPAPAPPPAYPPPPTGYPQAPGGYAPQPAGYPGQPAYPPAGPPVYYPPAPGAPPVYGYGNPTFDRYAAEAQYQSLRRHPLLALGLELLLPGIGNIYADAPLNSIITWAAMVAGFVLLVDGAVCDDYDSRYDTYGDCVDDGKVDLGAGLLVGGWLYGVVSAPIAAGRHNAQLRERLGLDVAGLAGPPRIAAAPSPTGVLPLAVRGGGGLSYRLAF